MHKTLLAVAIAAATSSVFVPLTHAQDESHGYVGLQWIIGKTKMPNIVVGYRELGYQDGDRLSGGDLSLSYRWGEGVDRLALKAVSGDLDAQAEFGVGYSFVEENFLISLGAQFDRFNATLAYMLDDGVQVELMANSIRDYDEEHDDVVVDMSPEEPDDTPGGDPSPPDDGGSEPEPDDGSAPEPSSGLAPFPPHPEHGAHPEHPPHEPNPEHEAHPEHGAHDAHDEHAEHGAHPEHEPHS